MNNMHDNENALPIITIVKIKENKYLDRVINFNYVSIQTLAILDVR